MLRRLAGKVKRRLMRYWYYYRYLFHSYLSETGKIEKQEQYLFMLYNMGVPMSLLSRESGMTEAEVQAIYDRKIASFRTADNCAPKLNCWELNFSRDMTCIYPNVWRIGGEYVLKNVSNREKAEKEIRISETLSRYNFPYDYPRFFRGREGEYFCQDAILMNCMAGHPVMMLWDCADWEEKLTAVGRLLAQFHKVMAESGVNEGIPEGELMGIRKMLLRVSLLKPSLHLSLRKSYRILENADLERGCTHGDFHMGNIHFSENGQLSGILDFGNAQMDYFLDDLAYFVFESSLVFDQEQGTELFRKGMQALFRGYWGENFEAEYALNREYLLALMHIQCAKLMIFFTLERVPYLAKRGLRCQKFLDTVL